MYILVKTWDVQMLIYLMSVFFKAESLSKLRVSSVQSGSLGQSVSVNDHPGQAGCSTDWWGARSHFLYFLVYLITHCFPSST